VSFDQDQACFDESRLCLELGKLKWVYGVNSLVSRALSVSLRQQSSALAMKCAIDLKALATS